jgi:UDP-2-acetamido-3-amino-2,3-dideoxy-glucuronate N-acetyltransferase
LVRTGASIGANAVLVCGITVGKWAMIGAGSVVTKDVPDYALVVGNPARIIGYVDEDGNRIEQPK